MSRNNKISVGIVILVLVAMSFAAGVYFPMNIVFFKAMFLSTPEPIETFTIAPAQATVVTKVYPTFTTMPSPTRYQSPTPAATAIPSPTPTAMNEAVRSLNTPTPLEYIAKGTVRQNVKVYVNFDETSSVLGELKKGNEVTIVDARILGEGGPMWLEVDFPIGQTDKVGWIPNSDVQYPTETSTATPTDSPTSLPSSIKPAPECFFVFYDNWYWRVLGDNQQDDPQCGIVYVESDQVFDHINNSYTINTFKMIDDGPYTVDWPQGGGLYLKKYTVILNFKGPYVWVEGVFDPKKSEISSNGNTLTFSIKTKTGTINGNLTDSGQLTIDKPVRSATSTVTATSTPTKVATRVPPTKTPVVITIQNEKHTFDYKIVISTMAYSSPDTGAQQFDSLEVGRLVEPILYQIKGSETWYLVLYLDTANTTYRGVGWIPGTSLDRKPTNIRSVPLPGQ